MHPFQQRARQAGTPIIDDEKVTFLWEGDEPPYLVGDFNDWDPARGKEWKALQPGVWIQSFSFALDAYIEYAFLTEPQEEARITDPHNERTVPNGVGFHNQYFAMPGRPPNLLLERGGVTPGQLTKHRIENKYLIAGEHRWLHLYRPPVDEPTPLLVVYDGQDYLTRGRITQVVDNLIHHRRIRPVSLALIEHGVQARCVEYSASEATIELVVSEILPRAAQQLNLVDWHAEPYGIMGASLSGFMATYTALRVPQVFGKVLCQSGAFATDGVESVTTAFVRHFPLAPIKIWMDVGRYEWLLEANRQFHALLSGQGYDVTYREYNAGHNYTSWRDEYWRGLETLFPVQG